MLTSYRQTIFSRRKFRVLDGIHRCQQSSVNFFRSTKPFNLHGDLGYLPWDPVNSGLRVLILTLGIYEVWIWIFDSILSFLWVESPRFWKKRPILLLRLPLHCHPSLILFLCKPGFSSFPFSTSCVALRIFLHFFTL